MRQYIRTVKPELFRHEELFDLETENTLPCRLFFIGLLTCCDREGRFLWRPRTLKSLIMPYDDQVDVSKMLDLLAEAGFVERYGPESQYGLIPSFGRHQNINNRESDSDIPPPERLDDACPTRAPRGDCEELQLGDATQQPPSNSATRLEGNGKERKGKEHLEHASSFSEFWNRYPKKVKRPDAEKAWRQVAGPDHLTAILESLRKKEWPPDPQFIPYPATWLRNQQWLDDPRNPGWEKNEAPPPTVKPPKAIPEPEWDWKKFVVEAMGEDFPERPWSQVDAHDARLLLAEFAKRPAEERSKFAKKGGPDAS